MRGKLADLEIPDLFSGDVRVAGNAARQLLVPAQRAAVSRRSGKNALRLADDRLVHLYPTRRGLDAGTLAIRATAAERDRAAPEFAAGERAWLTKAPPRDPAEVLESHEAGFRFLEADRGSAAPGLWPPQLGAIHSVLGHWTTQAEDVATVAMPTGTGKTEAMVGLFAAQRPARVLVIVPSDPLRTQIAEKFERLGVLQTAGVISPKAMRPVVGRVRHRFGNNEEAREFARACNVVVTTPQALGSSADPAVAQAFLDEFTHLFVDEAHHVAAPTWARIRDQFGGKPTVQFTATPYREDGKPLGGRRLYRYPVSVAQRAGYFAEIDYHLVVDLHDRDGALVRPAVRRLREDRTQGFNHLLMARTKSVPRAEAVLELYREHAPDLNPVLIHSRMPKADARAAVAALRDGTSQIVVCVDMLGEGFDLPELKIAAIHDSHKSLGVTLQFIGRFTRTAGTGIGRAAVFVGRPDLDFSHGLRRLYAEDADWNQVISDLSERRTAREEDIGEFEEGFGPEPDLVPLRSIAPKMSTVVYRTHCEDWNPEAILDAYPEETLLSTPLPINHAARVAWFVVKSVTPVRWGDLPEVEEVSYGLFVIYWNRTDKLLYINVSDTSIYPDALAKKIAGGDVELVKGQAVYRAMAKVQRLIPTNVGVLDVLDAGRRFSLHTGANVAEGFTDAEAGTKTPTNIFGSGFEDGERVTIGASLKGRVWSFAQAETLKHWVDWCDHVGPLLVDESISVEEVKGSFILPEELTEMPGLVPLSIEWPVEAFLNTSDASEVRHGGSSSPLAEAELRVTKFTTEAPLEFEVRTAEWSVPYKGDIAGGTLVFQAAGEEAEIRRGLHGWIALSEYLTSKSSGPRILLESEAMLLAPAFLLKPAVDREAYQSGKLTVPAWTPALNLRQESQGAGRDAASVQAQTISYVSTLEDWKVMIDDDGTGEVADIVAMRVDGGDLHVMLTHCKYSSADNPRARVGDLYDVCGQAQRSATYRGHIQGMLRKLIRREGDRVRNHGRSGFEIGELKDLYEIADCAHLLRPVFTIAISQPGLSKARVADNQLQLLASTEAYVRQVAKADFVALCSP